MSEFKREGRYIVVKPDCEDSLRTERLRNHIDEMCFKTPDCVVVEADWPEYEPVWRMIERRVTGASADAKPVEVLGYSVVGNPYAIRLTKGEVLELSENYADHLIELVDRKHLTDAQVELAALREELAEEQLSCAALASGANLLKQRLATAEQRNAELVDQRKTAEQEVIIASGLLKRAASEIESLATSLENACEDFEGEEDEDPQATEEVDYARKLAAEIRSVMAKPTESGASE